MTATDKLAKKLAVRLNKDLEPVAGSKVKIRTISDNVYIFLASELAMYRVLNHYSAKLNRQGYGYSKVARRSTPNHRFFVNITEITS